MKLLPPGTNFRKKLMDPLVIIILILFGFILYKKLNVTSVNTVKSLIKAEYVLIDVRTPGEFNGGHVDGALNIPLDEIGRLPEGIPEDKSTPIFVYCLSGMRSGSAAAILKKNGFTEVHNLGGVSRAQSVMKAARKD